MEAFCYKLQVNTSTVSQKKLVVEHFIKRYPSYWNFVHVLQNRRIIFVFYLANQIGMIFFVFCFVNRKLSLGIIFMLYIYIDLHGCRRERRTIRKEREKRVVGWDMFKVIFNLILTRSQVSHSVCLFPFFGLRLGPREGLGSKKRFRTRFCSSTIPHFGLDS